MSKLDSYLNLLSTTYDEAIEYLLQKYGGAKDDYFKKESYLKFLKGDIKSIAKGKISRTSEGLYCHHIDENIHPNLTNLHFIGNYQYHYKYQRKERLVYCDLIEHSILHVLIGLESDKKLGVSGFYTHLRDDIEKWYILQIKPQEQWKLNCFKKSYVSQDEAFLILKRMHGLLEEPYEETLEECHSRLIADKKYKDYIVKINLDKRKSEPSIISRAKKINISSPSREVLESMYELNKLGANAYRQHYSTFPLLKEFGMRRVEIPVEFEVYENEMKNYPIENVIKNIQLYLDYKEGLIDRSDYIEKVRSYSLTKKEIEKRDKQRKEIIEEVEKKKNIFYNKYPKFKNTKIEYDSVRQDISAALFKIQNEYKSFIKYQTAIKHKSLEELLNALHDLYI